MSFNSSGSGPTLSLGIAHNYGAIWDLSWCPSGTWEPKLSTKKQVWYTIISQCLNGNISCVKMFQWNIRINCVVTIFPKVCKTNAQGCENFTSGWRAPLKNGCLKKNGLTIGNIGNTQIALSAVLVLQVICLTSLVSNIKFPGYFLSPNSIMICRFTSVLATFQMLCFALIFRMEPFPV